MSLTSPKYWQKSSLMCKSDKKTITLFVLIKMFVYLKPKATDKPKFNLKQIAMKKII